MSKMSLPLSFIGDNIRLKQILINLTKNALKFCSYGKITIKAAYDISEEMLKVHVIDTGKGIDPNEK